MQSLSNSLSPLVPTTPSHTLSPTLQSSSKTTTPSVIQGASRKRKRSTATTPARGNSTPTIRPTKMLKTAQTLDSQDPPSTDSDVDIDSKIREAFVGKFLFSQITFH